MNLKVLQWNARGLLIHVAELKNYLNTTINKPNVICIQESYLKPQNFFDLPPYTVLRKDRPDQRGGGLVTLVGDEISFSIIEDNPLLEALSIQINSSVGKIVIANVYHPPAVSFETSLYQNIFSRSKTIIVGDFNSKSPLWGSPKSDVKGIRINSLLEDNDLVCVNTGEGTFIKHQGGYSHLDLSIISKQLAGRAEWRVLSDCWGSDHLPITTEITPNAIKDSSNIVKWALKKADWDEYSKNCDILSAEINPICDNETLCNQVSEMIISAASRSIPKIKIKPRAKSVPFGTLSVQQLLKNETRQGAVWIRQICWTTALNSTDSRGSHKKY